MLIKACLNGSRTLGEHAALPVSPEQLAQAAQAVERAGAGAVHVHPRRQDGGQSLEPKDCAAALLAMRAACPGLPIGLSSAAFIKPDRERRHALIAAWTELPDFVSVNFAEPGAVELCALLLGRGVAIEAGLSSPGDAQLLAQCGLARRKGTPALLRVLIEPEETMIELARATLRAIERELDAAGIYTQRLLHGYEATAWPLLETAVGRGYDVRIGFEDTLRLPDGRLAQDNAELVSAARSRAAEAGRRR